MLRIRSRKPRSPRVYRIPIETYPIALAIAFAHALSNPSPIEGNRIRLLENGDAFFPAMLEAIARARSSINLETYIFWSGEIAGRFRNALSERARAGVEVRVLLDAVGSGSKLSRDDVSVVRAAECAVEFVQPLLPVER